MGHTCLPLATDNNNTAIRATDHKPHNHAPQCLNTACTTNQALWRLVRSSFECFTVAFCFSRPQPKYELWGSERGVFCNTLAPFRRRTLACVLGWVVVCPALLFFAGHKDEEDAEVLDKALASMQHSRCVFGCAAAAWARSYSVSPLPPLHAQQRPHRSTPLHTQAPAGNRQALVPGLDALPLPSLPLPSLPVFP